MKEVNRDEFISILRSLSIQVRELSSLNSIGSDTCLYGALVSASSGLDLALNHSDEFADE